MRAQDQTQVPMQAPAGDRDPVPAKKKKKVRRLPAFMCKKDNHAAEQPHASLAELRTQVRSELNKRVAKDQTAGERKALRRAAEITQRAQERTRERQQLAAEKVRKAQAAKEKAEREQAEREQEERRLSGELAPEVRRMILDYALGRTRK